MIPMAVVTMVYDDDIYLDIWLRYWTARLPRGNLFVLMHKDYEKYETLCAGCNTLRINRPEMHADFETDRWKMIAEICSGLSRMYQRVIYTDVDEIIALDPATGDDLVGHILSHPAPILSPFGVEVVQNLDREHSPYDPTRPVLAQRRYVAPHPMYSKPCIISQPVRWGSGGHYHDRPEITLSPDLTLFHLRLFDEGNYLDRSKQRRAMIVDPVTGEPMAGVGGPTWRRTENEMTAFDPGSETPIKDFAFPKRRDQWMRSAHFDKELKLWKRRGPVLKHLFRIPERFEALF